MIPIEKANTTHIYNTFFFPKILKDEFPKKVKIS